MSWIPSISDIQELLSSETLNTAFLIVAGCAAATFAFFHCYEPQSIPVVAFLLLLVPTGLSGLVSVYYTGPLWHAVGFTFLVYYAAIYFYLFVYRVGPLHPLMDYRGPHWCKLSKLWILVLVKTGKKFKYIQFLHAQKGDVVRVGPNELSIRDPSRIKELVGSQTIRRIPSSLELDLNASLPSAHLNAWERTFQHLAPEHLTVIDSRVAQLVQALSKERKRENIAQQCSHLAFDVMGDLVFGGGYELMKNVDNDDIWKKMENTIDSSATFDTVPWLRTFAQVLPGYQKDLKDLRSSFQTRATRRHKREDAPPVDLFHYISDDEPPSNEAVGELGLAMLYGSTIISSLLSNAIYFLLGSEIEYKQVQDEVDGSAQDQQIIDAVIGETLRLYPPLPGGCAHIVDRGDSRKALGKEKIPPGTVIRYFPYCTQRTATYFSPDTDIFWPGRWLMAEGKAEIPLAEDEKFIHDAEAFIPFLSADPRVQALEPTVRLVARKVLSALFKAYDLKFAEGYDSNKWERVMKEAGLWKKGELWVTVSPRKKRDKAGGDE